MPFKGFRQGEHLGNWCSFLIGCRIPIIAIRAYLRDSIFRTAEAAPMNHDVFIGCSTPFVELLTLGPSH
jgi:hypothetical protein